MTGSDLDGLRILVTGGGSGIGRAIATAAATRGAVVAILDLEVASAPGGVLAYRADVTDDEAVARGVAAAAAAMGGLDAVVNNAGIGAQGTVETNSIDEWRTLFDVNVFGMVRVRAAQRFPTSAARLGLPS